MTANENNRKYIAEAWIENGEDEAFKKSFLEHLLKQYQVHTEDGSGFCADMVDGLHASDIRREIEEATEHFLTEFQIGNTAFKQNKKSALGFSDTNY